MPTPARHGKPLAHIVHNDKDLRIDAGPQDVAKGDPPRRREATTGDAKAEGQDRLIRPVKVPPL